MCQYDYSKLKGRIVEKFGKQTNFAEHLGKDDPYVSRYLTGNAVFTQKVVEVWRQALDLDIPDIGPYFFKPKC